MLSIVATPIGNLRDITLRALDVLRAADVIYCEDTRHSMKLLRAHGIQTPLKPYHEHNAAKVRPGILQALQQGKHIALISDAGTPLISDPGYKLVQEAREMGLAVTPIPGACAAITALCAAGLPSDRFLFAGFLPPKTAARKAALEEIKHVQATVVLYESPKRIAACVKDVAEVFGARQIVVARELTKQYEEFRRGQAGDIAAAYEAEDSPKGEIVLLIAPGEASAGLSDEQVAEQLRQAMQSYPVKEAAAMVAETSGRSKRELYQRALSLKGES